MQTPAVSFCKWQERYATDEACAVALADLHWPNGFRCPQCGHDHGWYAARVGMMNVLAVTTKPHITAGTPGQTHQIITIIF